MLQQYEPRLAVTIVFAIAEMDNCIAQLLSEISRDDGDQTSGLIYYDEEIIVALVIDVESEQPVRPPTKADRARRSTRLFVDSV